MILKQQAKKLGGCHFNRCGSNQEKLGPYLQWGYGRLYLEPRGFLEIRLMISISSSKSIKNYTKGKKR